MPRKCALAIAVVLLSLFVPQGTANAQTSCSRAVVFTLPGVTWDMVDRVQPPELLALAEESAVGSIAVRTISSRTSYASGFLTLGAGTRADGGRLAGGVAQAGQPIVLPGGTAEYLKRDVVPTGAGEIISDTEDAYYEAEAYALADSLDVPVGTVGNADPGLEPPVPLGFGRWVLLSGLRPDGSVAASATGPELLIADPDAPYGVRTDGTALRTAIDEAFQLPCAVVVVDQGDLIRMDMQAKSEERPPSDGELREALLAADDALGVVRSHLGPEDLLLVVTPTSPWWDREVHLGVALAHGPGFAAGDGLVSASTRQDGIVTLPDVAPTLMAALGADRPASMLGRPFRSIDVGSGDRIASAIELDDESVFAHSLQADISTGFVIAQVIVYTLTFLFLTRRKPFVSVSEGALRWLEIGGLAVVTFPLVSYLQTPIPGHRLGVAGFVALLIGLDALVVALVMRMVDRPLHRLHAIVASTIGLLVVDLASGMNLQLNAVWGNDPIVAGRFTGLGNIAFTVLGSSSLLTGAIWVHRRPRDRRVLLGVIALFAVTVVVDGAPGLGSDVGGVLALVPALGITTLLLAGKRPTVRAILISGAAALVALGAFLMIDLSQPSSERTHLGQLYERISDRGGAALWDAVERKISTNIRVFRSTIWTYLMPPALGVMAWLLRRPRGRWKAVAERYPRLRAGLIGGLVLGVLGFAVNDSGIVVPAMTMTYLVPLALLLHLTLERERLEGTT